MQTTAEENLYFFEKTPHSPKENPSDEIFSKNDDISMETNIKTSRQITIKTREFTLIKPLNFSEKVRKTLEIHYFEQEELINAVLSFVESDKINRNLSFFTWFLCYFLYIETNNDTEILSDIVIIYQGQIQELWSFSNKMPKKVIKIKDLQNEFTRKNPIIVENILDFFIENDVFLPFLSQTLRKMAFNFSLIPQEIISKVITKEKHFLLNHLLIYRDKSEESAIKEIKNHKNGKLVKELLTYHMQKENNNNRQEMLHALISKFLQENHQKLLSLFLYFSRKSIQKSDLAIDALTNNCSHYIFKCLKLSFKFPIILLKEPVFLALMQAFHMPNVVEEAIWMLFETRKYVKSFTNLHIKLLVDKIEYIVKNDSLNLLSFCVFPIGALVMIIELLRLLSRKKRNQYIKILNLSSKLLELTMIYLKEINEISILHHILCKSFAKTQKKMKIIDIFMGDPLFYKEILATNFMGNILKNQLSAGFQYDFNLLVASTSYQYLSSVFSLRHVSRKKITNYPNSFPNSSQKVEKHRESLSSYSLKIIDGNIFNYIRKPEISDTNLTNHIYSFLMFTRNINLRLFIAFVFFSLSTGFLYNEIFLASQLLSNVSNVNKDIINFMTDFTLPPKYKEKILMNLLILPTNERGSNVLYQKYITNSSTSANSFAQLSIKDINPEEICNLMFVIMTNTKEMVEYVEECVLSATSFVQFSDDLTTFIGVVCLILIISSEIYVTKVYMHLKGYSPTYFSLRSLIYELSFVVAIILIVFLVRLQSSFNRFSINDWIWDISFINILFNCQLVFLMVILFFYLSNLEKFGRIVKMIVLVIQQLSKFFFVLAINCLYVALAFYVIFSGELEEFHLFFDCIKIVVEGFLGSFVFLEDERISCYLHYICCFVMQFF